MVVRTVAPIDPITFDEVLRSALHFSLDMDRVVFFGSILVSATSTAIISSMVIFTNVLL